MRRSKSLDRGQPSGPRSPSSSRPARPRCAPPGPRRTGSATAGASRPGRRGAARAGRPTRTSSARARRRTRPRAAAGRSPGRAGRAGRTGRRGGPTGRCRSSPRTPRRRRPSTATRAPPRADQVPEVWPDDVGDDDRAVVAVGGQDRPGSPGCRRRSRRGCRPARAHPALSPPASAAPAGRPNRAIVSSSRSCGSAWAVIPSRPVIVSAATSALRIASSVASIVAVEQRRRSRSRSGRGRRRSAAGRPERGPRAASGCRWRSTGTGRRSSARPVPPIRAMPRPARWASRSHWWGRSGASVATMTMIEPDRRRGGGRPASTSALVVVRVRARDLRDRDRLADRDAVDPEPARAGRSSPGRGRRP